MFAELGAAMTTGRKFLKSDCNAWSSILVASIVICLMIMQMDLESLIIAYISTGTLVLVLRREHTFPKQNHCLWQHGESQPFSKPYRQQQPKNVFNTRRSPPDREPHNSKPSDCIESLADNEYLDFVKSGSSSASEDGSLSSSPESESELVWPLEPKDEPKKRSPSAQLQTPSSQLPATLSVLQAPSSTIEPTDYQYHSCLEFHPYKFKEDDQRHFLLDLYQCEFKADPAFDEPEFGPETNKALDDEPAHGQLRLSLEEPDVSNAFPALPSLGSKFHPEECIPCKFLVSRSGCKDGEACVYCHAPHPDLNQGQRRRLMSRINRKKRQEGVLNGQVPQNDATHDQTPL